MQSSSRTRASGLSGKRRRPHPDSHGLRRNAIIRANALLATLDGSILDLDEWRRRHRTVLLIAGLQVAVCLGVALSEVIWREGTEWELANALLITAAFAAAALPLGSRRWREAAITASMTGAVIFIARYMGNVGGLVVINVMLLALYQDWLPLAMALASSFITGLLGIVDPSLFEDFVSYQAERPDVATLTRSLGAMVSVLVVFLIWRAGGHLSLDPLSGLLSRNGIEQIIDRESRAGRVPAVFVLDVDNFGRMSESMDVQEADKLLAQIGRHILRSARRLLPAQSWTARVEGDVYAIATANSMQRPQAEEAALALMKAVEADPVYVNGAGVGITITVSIGVRCGRTKEPASDMIAVAKSASRKAKGQGHKRVRVESPGYSRVIRPNMPSREMAEACRSGQLLLHYQPIVDLQSAELRSAEALMRWRHPVQGMIPASNFIKTVESDSALMADVTNALMTDFFRQIKRWEPLIQRGWLPDGAAFNISAVRFQDPSFLGVIEAQIAETGVNPAHITLEITEGALALTEYEPVKKVKHLREMGFRIALDDFGCGYSSLAHLRDFPLNGIKIDRSFVHHLDRSDLDRSVIKAILEIAHGASLSVACEGVETERQQQELLELNRHMLGQGWLWAKAMSPEQLATWAVGS